MIEKREKEKEAKRCNLGSVLSGHPGLPKDGLRLFMLFAQLNQSAVAMSAVVWAGGVPNKPHVCLQPVVSSRVQMGAGSSPGAAQ